MVATIVKYNIPLSWISYDQQAVSEGLLRAKSAILSLQSMPFQLSWLESLRQVEFKREIKGTSRIEGADFTEREFEDALNEPVENLVTRSQKQARAAQETYHWISTIEKDQPIDKSLVLKIHRRIVTGADDDHCEPAKLRPADVDVHFGQPRHRGASGGEECERAFNGLMAALQTELTEHEPIIQALAAHYHLAAMHPFLDGNGRTARVLEALFLQRAGVMDVCFVAMSNYYYEEKTKYLASLAEVRARGFDLTPFLIFGLRGIETQIKRILKEIQKHVSKALFINLAHELFGRLKSRRDRLVPKRQLAILKTLLQSDIIEYDSLFKGLFHEHYSRLRTPGKAFNRDMNALWNLGAMRYKQTEEDDWYFWANLDWPTQITETDFYKKMKELPKAKTPF